MVKIGCPRRIAMIISDIALNENGKKMEAAWEDGHRASFMRFGCAITVRVRNASIQTDKN